MYIPIFTDMRLLLQKLLHKVERQQVEYKDNYYRGTLDFCRSHVGPIDQYQKNHWGNCAMCPISCLIASVNDCVCRDIDNIASCVTRPGHLGVAVLYYHSISHETVILYSSRPHSLSD